MPRRQSRSITQRNALVMQHSKLVHQVARRYKKPGVDYEGLVQEGHIGLMRAAQSYRAKRGKFSTYATPWIRKYVQKGVRDGFSVRLPERRLKGVRPQIVPLEAAERMSGGGIRRAEARVQLSRVRKRLGRLSAQQQKIMRMRYFTGRPATARQVAKRLKLTPGRVSQLEKSARQKLRG